MYQFFISEGMFYELFFFLSYFLDIVMVSFFFAYLFIQQPYVANIINYKLPWVEWCLIPNLLLVYYHCMQPIQNSINLTAPAYTLKFYFFVIAQFVFIFCVGQQWSVPLPPYFLFLSLSLSLSLLPSLSIFPLPS